jgi:hypothetical protein
MAVLRVKDRVAEISGCGRLRDRSDAAMWIARSSTA